MGRQLYAMGIPYKVRKLSDLAYEVMKIHK
jgi:hypothetical protein